MSARRPLVGSLLCIAAVAVTPPASGEAPPTLPDGIDWIAYYSQVCGDVDQYVALSDEAREKLDLAAPIKQRISYCAQAKMSQKGYHFGIAESSANAVAATVCTANCLATSIPYLTVAKPALDRACTIAGLGANAAAMGMSIAMAKDFGDWIKSNAMSMVSLGMSAKSIANWAPTTGVNPTTISTADKIESCVGAGMLISQAAMTSYQAGQARGPWGQALYQAGQLKSGTTGINSNDQGRIIAQSSVGVGTPITSPSDAPSQATLTPDACQTAVNTRTIAASTECASSLGQTFPTGIYDPLVQDAFKQISGQDVASFLKSGGDVASALTPLLSGPQAQAALRAKQNQMLTAALSDPRMAQYASSGGARRGAHGKSDSGLDLSGLLKGLLPGSGNDKKEDASARAQAYGVLGARGPAGMDPSNDPQVSLFDRVSTAYRAQSARTGTASADAWSLPVNRASHGLK